MLGMRAIHSGKGLGCVIIGYQHTKHLKDTSASENWQEWDLSAGAKLQLTAGPGK